MPTRLRPLKRRAGRSMPDMAKKLEQFILSAGGSEEAEVLYTEFRGRMPGVEALLKGRGLSDAA